MTNMLIADDEHHIVNYIASLLEAQQELDLEIYRAYSGIEALESIEKMKFDLMLLDINMPGASGLEIAQRVSSLWPRCKILFLTAYDNFDYIYRAISFKCSGYLLKVETDSTIINTICEVVKDIKADLLITTLVSEAKQKSLYLSHLLHQTVLKGIVLGWDEETVKKELGMMSPDNPIATSRPFYMMYTCISPKSVDNRSDYPILSYIQFMELLLCQKFTCHTMQCNSEHLLWLFQSTNEESDPTDIVYLKNIADDFVDNYYINENEMLLSILYSEAVSLKSIGKIYYLLQCYADNLYRKDEPYVIFLQKSELHNITKSSENIDDTDKLLKKLSSSIYLSDNTQFISALSSLKGQCNILKSMHSLSAIKIYFSISLILIKYIDQNKLQEALAMKIALYPLYSSDFPNWDNAFDYLQKVSRNIFELVDLKKLNRNEHIISLIKNYITENLSENITLSKISELVNYNDSYISRLFKNITGEGVSEYINHTRIDKAKMFLSTTDTTIQGIADITGFDTSQYFSSVFKKSVGVSPTDYRINNVK